MSGMVRMPSPFVRRPRFLEKLPTLNLAQGNLEGIANEQYTAIETLTWETATDWDNASSETETVVHENFGDFTDTVVQLGYPSDVLDNLVAYWHLHEDSGSTAGDAGPNGITGTINGATVGQSGILGTTSYQFDGSDDWVDFGDPSSLSSSSLGDSYSFFMWVNLSSTSGDWLSHASSSQNDNWRWYDGGSGNREWYTDDDNTDLQVAGSVITGSWASYAGVYRTSQIELYENGSSIGSSSASSSTLATSSSPWALFSRGGDSGFVSGKAAFVLIFNDGLSDSEVSTLHDVTSGSLTTGTKSFSSSATPDLQNLSYSLNGGSIDLNVIGSPGTASEEIVTQTLDGSTSYSLTWSNSHQDFQLRPNLSVSGITNASPTFDRGELIA